MRYRFRSAITGRWIPKWLAVLLPWISVREKRD